MSPFSIIVDLDILKNRSFRLFSARKHFLVTAFCFEGCPETLHHRVIIAITLFAHTSHHAMLLKQQVIARARIFTSAIRVMRPVQLPVAADPEPCEVPL